jgi:hypothetical protein
MSRQKGKRGEREAAAELSALLGDGVSGRRGVQFQGGPDSPDVVLTGSDGERVRLHVEAKRTESLNVYKALDQARADAPDGVPAIVWHRRNGRESVVICATESLAAIAQEITKHIATRK